MSSKPAFLLLVVDKVAQWCDYMCSSAIAHFVSRFRLDDMIAANFAELVSACFLLLYHTIYARAHAPTLHEKLAFHFRHSFTGLAFDFPIARVILP